MGERSHAHAVLTIQGQELNPDRISEKLGVSPTSAARKGETRQGLTVPNKVGTWTIDVRVDDLSVLDQAVRSIVERTTQSTNEWAAIVENFDVYLTLVFYLYSANEGASLEAPLLELLASRRIRLDFDLYSLAGT